MGADPLRLRQLRGVCGVVVDDRARPLRWQRREPGVLGGDHAIRRHEGERASAAALAEQHGDARHGQPRHVGQAPGDLAGECALLGARGQVGARGVDHRDEREAELLGQAYPALRLAQGGRPHRLPRLVAAVLADEDARQRRRMR